MTSPRPQQRRDKVARAVEAGGNAVAAPVGAALTGAKLRDAYRKDYGAHYARGAEVATARAAKVGQRTSRVARALSHGEPGFVPLAAATVAASTSVGARRYRRHREAKLGPVAKSSPFLGESVSKGLFHHGQKPPQHVLRALGQADDAVRNAKNAVLPPTAQLVARGADKASSATGQAVTALKAKQAERMAMAKAYDPQRSRRRRARAAEAGLAGGAGLMARSASRERRDAHGRWAASLEQQRAADRSFNSAATWSDKTTNALIRHGKGPGVEGNLPPTKASLAQTQRMSAAAGNNVRRGVEHATQALGHAEQARRGVRVARNKGVAAIALTAGALEARRRARRRDY